MKGGAEMQAEGLRAVLARAGHEADIVTVPFRWHPPQELLNSMLASSLLDLNEACGERVDLMIALKFPAWLIEHRRKVLWIIHQHRDAYDLWGHELGALHGFPNGALVRSAVETADRAALAAARRVFAESGNVARRLKRFCDFEAAPLYHPPPGADRFRCEPAQDYFYCPGRLSPAKRQHLILEALAETRNPIQLCFSGAPEPAYGRQLLATVSRLKITDRVRWLGHVSEEEKLALYARATAVVYPPLDEDYGYVPLESMLSSKPVITCSDSGEALEFVRNGDTGVVCDPAPGSLAAALDLLWENRGQAQQMGALGKQLYTSMNITWELVVKSLLA